MNSDSQQGFSLIEMIAGIVVLGVLATAFLSAFSSVLRTSASPLQTVAMENIAVSQMDYLLSGTFQSAVAASGTTQQFTVDGVNYWAVITGRRATVSGITYNVASSVHLTVTVNTVLSPSLCASCVSLSGDTFNVQ